MTVSFSYDKRKVLQALRYHFLSKKEIRFMIILVNVFAFVAVVLFFMKKVLPFAFLFSSFLWFFLMISFWFILPGIVYRRSATFLDHFTMDFEDAYFTVGNERGSRQFKWSSLSSFLESPYFFYLYFDARSFFLVPKEAFSSDQIFEMRHLLQEKLKK